MKNDFLFAYLLRFFGVLYLILSLISSMAIYQKLELGDNIEVYIALSNGVVGFIVMLICMCIASITVSAINIRLNTEKQEETN